MEELKALSQFDADRISVLTGSVTKWPILHNKNAPPDIIGKIIIIIIKSPFLIVVVHSCFYFRHTVRDHLEIVLTRSSLPKRWTATVTAFDDDQPLYYIYIAYITGPSASSPSNPIHLCSILIDRSIDRSWLNIRS